MNPSYHQSPSVYNVTSDNSEDGPWPKDTIFITGDSILSGLQPGLLSQQRKVKVKTFSGANVRDMHDNIKPVLWHKPEYIILHIGTNDVLNLPPNEILDKISELKYFTLWQEYLSICLGRSWELS